MSWRFAANFVQLHKTENPAPGKRQLALSGVPDLMELAAGQHDCTVKIGLHVANGRYFPASDHLLTIWHDTFNLADIRVFLLAAVFGAD